MDNETDPPARPTPPPPDLPSYTPPVPSLGTTPGTPPATDPLDEHAKIKLRVAQAPDSDLSPHGVLAPFNTRVIAAVIDCMLAFGLQIATWIVLPAFVGGSLPMLVGLAYLVTRDSLPFLGGQSVGKKAMHLKAVTLDGQSLAGNWQPGLIRNVVLAIPLFVLVELFILLSREDKPERGRRLGDEWANTKVIVVEPAPDKNPAAPE